MKKMTLSLIAVTFLLSGDLSGAKPEKQTRVRQVLFHVRVLEGDPLGSREAGTIKVLAEPTIVTTENREFSVNMINGVTVINTDVEPIDSVETGLKIKGNPGKVVDGHFRLDLSVSYTTFDAQVENTTEFTTVGKRIIKTIKLSEMYRFRIGQKNSHSTERVWMELSAEIIDRLDK